MPEAAPISVREYGTAGPAVIVLHGGSGAAGDPAPVARALADRFRVLEPRRMRKPQTGGGLG